MSAFSLVLSRVVFPDFSGGVLQRSIVERSVSKDVSVLLVLVESTPMLLRGASRLRTDVVGGQKLLVADVETAVGDDGVRP